MNEEKECINPPEDDGSLAWLHIPSDASRRQFNCPGVTQQKLVNAYYGCTYIDNYLHER